MSYLDTGKASQRQEGPGWWLASDGLWYAPELHPDFVRPEGGENQISASPVATATAPMPFQPHTIQSNSRPPSRARRQGRIIVPALILVVVVAAAVTVSVVGGSSGWTDSSLHVVGSPIVAGGNVIVLDVTKAHHLEFSAINPSNGSVVWRKPVSPSAITSGVSFGPIAVGDTVLGLTPSGSPQNPNVFLQGINAVSGKVTWSVPGSALVSDAPGVCPGGNYFCIAGYTSDTATALVALDPTSGHVVAAVNGPERNMGVFALGSSVFEGGLWETSANTPTFMQVSNTGTPLWTKTVASIFGSSNYDPNYGWAFAQRGPLEVGFVGMHPSPTPSTWATPRRWGSWTAPEP